MSKIKLYPTIRDNFKIDSLINKPQNIGTISEDELKNLDAKLFSYTYGKCANGLQITIYWALNKDEQIVDCKLQVFGESELIAIASVAGLISRNKTPKEILNLKEKGLEYFLRENPNNTALPFKLGYLTNVIIYAMHQCALSYLGEETDTSDIVDNSSGATLNYIKWVIKEHNIKSLDDLVAKSGAGIYDKSCQYSGAGESLCAYYLDDILKDTIREQEQEKSGHSDLLERDFKELNNEEKKLAITAIIDKHIRQMLIMDGGDLEILDVKTNGENTDVYIKYLGACSGCASADTGTLFAIEGILKQKLDKDIRVVPL